MAGRYRRKARLDQSLNGDHYESVERLCWILVVLLCQAADCGKVVLACLGSTDPPRVRQRCSNYAGYDADVGAGIFDTAVVEVVEDAAGVVDAVAVVDYAVAALAAAESLWIGDCWRFR